MSEIQSHSLILRQHEFDYGGTYQVQSGQSLLSMLLEASGGLPVHPSVEVRVGGVLAPREMWSHLKPKVGASIYVTNMSLSGGNNGVLRALLMVVVAIASVYTGGAAGAAYGAAWGAAASVAVTIVGTLIVNAIAPLPTPGGGLSGSDRQWNQLTGTANQINPWGAIPVVLGECRYFPPHAAIPYSENVGSDSFQYCMFDLGHGDLEASDFRIGNSSFSSYNNLTYEVNKQPTIYTSDVAETVVNFSMNQDGNVATRTTAQDVDSISLDILFPTGLLGFGTSGKDFLMWVVYRVQIREAGTSGAFLNVVTTRLSKMSSTWTPQVGNNQSPSFPPSDGLYMVKTKDKNPFAAGLSLSVPKGQYEVRVTRVATLQGGSSNTYVSASTWTLLRSIRSVNPSTTGTNKLTMRIQATDQVTGTLQTLSCLVRQRIRVYNPGSGTWSAPQFNLNPAWVAYWLITESEALSKRIPSSRVDLDSFVDFANFCSTHGFETRDCQDAETTAGDLLRKILSNALASIGQRDGKYCVIFEKTGFQPHRMSFSPTEMTSFTEGRVFVVPPEALRIQFKNPDADWQEDELVVVRDGFSYLGKDARGNASSDPAAKTFQVVRLEQAIKPRQAWMIGRYHLAQSIFRQANYTWGTDISGVICTRGDVVEVIHDVAESWVGGGRVVSYSESAPSGFGGVIHVDTTVDLDYSKDYTIQISRAAGDSFTVNCKPHSARTNTFYVYSALDGIEYGQVVVVGVRGVEKKKVVISSIKYASDYTATFYGVDYDERIGQYWTNPPSTMVTDLGQRSYDAPEAPVINAIVSSSANDFTNDAGIASPVIRMSVNKQSKYLEVLQ